MEKLKGLLEYIAQKSECEYLSDLRIHKERYNIRKTIGEIEPQLYSLREWTDTVCYITERYTEFETVEQAVKYLLEYIL